ncbi:hypothetical protein K2X30_02850 [bacterium]|nr:hypothetical protein [bacterium]
MKAPQLTVENFKNGMLVDEELLGGVAENSPGEFTAFVLRPETGEYLGYQTCASLDQALQMINQVERDWQFEATSSCGENCGEGGCAKKAGGACKAKACENFQFADCELK